MPECWNKNEGEIQFRYLSEDEVRACVTKLTSTEQFHTTSIVTKLVA